MYRQINDAIRIMSKDHEAVMARLQSIEDKLGPIPEAISMAIALAAV